MRVLLVSASPINLEIGIGNTFLNIMPETMELASLYTRNGLPDKRIKKAFCVNEKMIINKLSGNARYAGKIITKRYGEEAEIKRDKINESIMHLAQKKRYTVIFWVQELIWRINVWKSKELENFIAEFNPNLIFTLFTNNIFINRIILHVLKISGKPLVLYAWDNNYQWNRYQRSPLRWINQYFERIYMRKVMDSAEKLYVISDIQKRDYERIFHKKCTVLTKGGDFSGETPVKGTSNNPLQIVYTGNVGNNRWKSLAMIANVLERINCEGQKAQLRIYTATPLTGEMKTALGKGEDSIIMGSVPANKIPEIQKNADVLVHVEAFDSKNKFAVCQSFSTKIVDYLAKGACILAVGPRDIASIDYFIRNDAGLVASNENEVMDHLMRIITDSQIINKIGAKAFESGKRNHNKEKIEKIINKDLYEAATKGIN